MEKTGGFGARLKSIRKDRGLTQVALAELLGLNTQTFKDYESGKRAPTMKGLPGIASKLGLSLSALMSDPGSLPDMVTLSESVASDLSLDYRMLQKIASLGPGEMHSLKVTLDALYELSQLKAKTGT